MQRRLPLAVLKRKLTTSQKAKLSKLQRRLPLAVLKPGLDNNSLLSRKFIVATALTACGIETYYYIFLSHITLRLQRRLPLAVLKLRCILPSLPNYKVATALTACGIETKIDLFVVFIFIMLQRRLPLAVLKPFGYIFCKFVVIIGCNGAYCLRY